MSLQIKLATLAATLLTASNMCKELHDDLYGTPKPVEAKSTPEPIRLTNARKGANAGKKLNRETGRYEYPTNANSTERVLQRVSKVASKAH